MINNYNSLSCKTVFRQKMPLFIYCLHLFIRNYPFYMSINSINPHVKYRDFNNNLWLNKTSQLLIRKFVDIYRATVVGSYVFVIVITTTITMARVYCLALVPKLWGWQHILNRLIEASCMFELTKLKSLWDVHVLCTCLN